MFQRTTAKTNPKFKFSFWKILLPIIIGLGVVGFMFWQDLKEQDITATLKGIHLNFRLVLSIICAWLFMFGRDLGLSWRFHTLTDKRLSWWSTFKITYLCEFTSCVTPSAVGGSSLGMIFLNREGIEFGRATTLMLTTLFLDELFFVLSCPIIILTTPVNDLFSSGSEGFENGIKLTFIIIYTIITLWTALLFAGIIIWPKGIYRAITKLFSFRLFRRWSNSVNELCKNMVNTSKELRKKSIVWWIKVFGGTIITWVSRYLVVNALFFGFLPETDPYQWTILARQFIVWVVLMISPTPGGSGISEWLFSEFYANLIPTIGLALILALLWRIITYYIYLAIGALLIPRWLGQTITSLKKK